jgi:hypothetical protein
VGIHWWEFNRQRGNIRSIILFLPQTDLPINLATTFVISITVNFTWSRLNRVGGVGRCSMALMKTASSYYTQREWWKQSH